MSAACDVYSFGVLLLAALTGLEVYQDGEHIRDLVDEMLVDGIQQMPAPLVAASCSWSFPGGGDLMCSLMTLGLACSAPRKNKRPALPAVLQSLQQNMEALQSAMVRECLVCMNAPRSTIFEPCRHAVACANCAVLLVGGHAPCAVCRQPITAILPVHNPVVNTFIARR